MSRFPQFSFCLGLNLLIVLLAQTSVSNGNANSEKKVVFSPTSGSSSSNNNVNLNMLERDNYDGYQVYSVILQSKNQFEILNDLRSKVPIDMWSEPRPINVEKARRNEDISFKTDFMVSREHTQFVANYLQSHEPELTYTIMMSNVQEVIEEQKTMNQVSMDFRSQAHTSGRLHWEAYFRADEIYAWLDDLVANNSDLASISVIGHSTEGRPLKLVKISKPGSPANKSAILIDGGFHAREWISPAIVTYILDQVLNNRTGNSVVLDNVDLYIIPIVNVDGYEHSHQSSRMWRKTRSNHGGAGTCFGTDPNRNFDFKFGGSGTSNDRCSEIYRGPSPFSEPETQAVRDVALNSSINWKSYLTIHSYGQWWLTPWSWTYDLPEDYSDLMRFGQIGADALTQVHGTKFVVGATTEILGTTAGCSDDWAKAVAGIKYANTIEVRDTGRYGFLLPPNQIRATAEETWAGIRAVSLFNF